MKYVKITINKNRNNDNTKTGFIYPDNFKPEEINFVCWQNEWLDTECAIWKVDDGFVAYDWAEMISEEEAKQYISSYINNDKDINDDALAEDWKTRQDIILSRIAILWEY